MNNQYCEEHDAATVVGFEVPRSPDSSYNNVYPGNEDETRDPPLVPLHLQRTSLATPANRDTSGTLPLPQNVILNHLYIENSEAPRSVVALGFTHRFCSKYVTVVLYKPVQRREVAAPNLRIVKNSSLGWTWIGLPLPFNDDMRVVIDQSKTKLVVKNIYSFTDRDDLRVLLH